MKYKDICIDNRMFIVSNLDKAIQEIDILFNTEKTELIGDTSYGSNFEQFLWQLNPSAESLRGYIIGQIGKCETCNDFDVDVDVKIITGEYRNIYDVMISVSDKNTTKYRKYEFR